MNSLKIGRLEISPPFIQAPMAGITDASFRQLMRSYGCPFTFYEMVNARALACAKKQKKRLLALSDKDSPIGIQLLGADEKYLLRSIDILESQKIDLIDFNAACPVLKVVKRSEGAALLKNPEKFSRILKSMRRHISLPFSVKIRIGWDALSINASDIAKRAEDAGVDCIFIHGRTKAQGYQGEVDYIEIEKVKRNVSIPVVASGDILSVELAAKMLSLTKTDGILLARGILGNPWLYKQIESFFLTGAQMSHPALKERLEVMLKHFELMQQEYGEKRATVLFRKFIGWYLKGFPGARHVRAKSSKIKTKQELIILLEEAFG